MDLRFKKIKDYSSAELDFAIQDAANICREKHQLDFYMILRGIDAYMERRKRKEDLEIERSTKALSHK